MQINPTRLHKQSQLMADYRNQDERITKFFDYNPYENYQQRVMDLKRREFHREHLTDVLLKINREWNAPISTLDNIKRLKLKESTVVIGGQQAGLLTGPLYTLNKIISIIQFAKQEEDELGIPVIPVFWIAGEDHDFEEINHIYLSKENQMKKYKLKTTSINKRPVSDIIMDQTVCRQWVDQLFRNIKETEYTEKLYKKIIASLNQSESFTDFFAHLIFQVFEDEGLVLIDSAHPDVRELEKKHFNLLIGKQREISNAVYNSIQELKQLGYSLSLEADKSDGHLFYHQAKDRILLIRDEEGNWKGKQGEVILSTEELLNTVEKQPQLLSNNVVTRPLMQELLFPSLAFIAGPGEVSYWAALRAAFHALNMTMPPVVPRLSMTYIDRNTEKNAAKFDLAMEKLINEGTTDFKEDYINSKMTPPISDLANDIKTTVSNAHQPLRDLAKDIRVDLGELAEKNLQYLFRDIDFLEKRLTKAVENKYAKELDELTQLGLVLNPFGGLQERIWNPLPWINAYGSDWIKEIVNHRFSFTEDHYLIYL